MKTVMKKMFSLLLVAVLLVGMLPFQAFADGLVTINITLNGTSIGSITKDHPTAGGAPLNSWIEEAKASLPAKAQSVASCNLVGNSGNAVDAEAVVNGWTIFANFTTPGYCETCPSYSHNTTDEHCASCGWGAGHADTCTRNCTLGFDCPSQYHKSGCKYNLCATCGNAKHGNVPCCAECHTVNVHAATCTAGCDMTASCTWGYTHKDGCESQHTCSVCNKPGHLEKNCPDVIETCCGVQKGSAHRETCVTRCTEKRDCTNANHKEGCLHALCDVEGCQENDGHTGAHTGVACTDPNCDYALNHAGKHSYLCPEAGCDKAVNHTGNHSNQPEEIPGDSYLVVNVNLYTSDVKTATKQLIRYDNISSDTRVYTFISDHMDQINSLLPSGYTWGGNVYDHENDRDPEPMNTIVGNGRTVYINAYSAEDLVMIYVHNSRTMTPIRIIQYYGKKVNENITKKEVTSAVSKYFNIGGLAMYDEQSWEDYVAGKTVQSVDSLKITSEPFFIDVYISGTPKYNSASGYTADSSNPKTGDMIFAPVAVMGLSVSALAVLFFLNKKRAY